MHASLRARPCRDFSILTQLSSGISHSFLNHSWWFKACLEAYNFLFNWLKENSRMHVSNFEGLSLKFGVGAECMIMHMSRFCAHCDFFGFRSLWYLVCTNYRVFLLPNEAQTDHVHGMGSHFRILPKIAKISHSWLFFPCAIYASSSFLGPPLKYTHSLLTKTTTNLAKQQHKTQQRILSLSCTDFWSNKFLTVLNQRLPFLPLSYTHYIS